MKTILLASVLVALLSGCAGWDAMSGPEQEATVQQGVETGQAISAFLPFPFNLIAAAGVGVAGTVLLKKKKPILP